MLEWLLLAKYVIPFKWNEKLLKGWMTIIYGRDKWANNKSMFCVGWDEVTVSKKMVFDLEVNKRNLTRDPIENT